MGCTPLVPFPGKKLWLKAENLHPTGAFKLRGAFNKRLSLTPEQQARGVVAHFGRNHAGAVASAARALGIRPVVVMPAGAPHTKLDAARGCGAEVVLVGDASEERAARAAALARNRGLTPVPPYDDPHIYLGGGGGQRGQSGRGDVAGGTGGTGDRSTGLRRVSSTLHRTLTLIARPVFSVALRVKVTPYGISQSGQEWSESQ